MTKNPILEELHETRRRLLKESGGTLEGLVAGLVKRQRDSGRPILKQEILKQEVDQAQAPDAVGANPE